MSVPLVYLQPQARLLLNLQLLGWHAHYLVWQSQVDLDLIQEVVQYFLQP